MSDTLERSADGASRSDVAIAAALFAVDPAGLGGVVLRGGPGPDRDRAVSRLRELVPAASPWIRVPLHVTEDRLIGGVALAETLRSGRLIVERGVLAAANGGVVVLPMAERLGGEVTSRVCAALDRGELPVERDHVSAVARCRIGVVALDEGIDEERIPAALSERLALRVATDSPDARTPFDADLGPDACERARTLLPRVSTPDAIIEALAAAAFALGIASSRAPLLAARAARAHAALRGRPRVEDEDAAVAARLVLGPRASRRPDESDGEPAASEPRESPDDDPESRGAEAPEPPEDGGRDDSGDLGVDRAPQNVVLEAAKTGIPPGLLDALGGGRDRGASARSGGKSGAARVSTKSGRPMGARAASPRDGERLHVVETLRAAAPWQPLRGREAAQALRRAPLDGERSRRLLVRKEDFRVRQFQERAETCVIFCVDASGSSALQRLAEAKGAVEQVLADCYVRRDQVALVAFRLTSAELLVPPTRSLARVRRCLADMAGGGGTPLACGLDAALALALDARRRGRTPLLVVMTDGRANVARNGAGGSIAPLQDALGSARAVRASGVRALFIDTAPRPRPEAKQLAKEMAAKHLPLPYLDAKGISREVRSLATGAP
jgi:magnesium chelatase subunit D